VPWKETCPMDERVQFIAMYLQKEWSIAELCGEFGISRPTGYKWIARYEEGGVETLVDRSRAPHHHPNQVSPEIEEAIVSLRSKHPRWGPLKLLSRLKHLQQQRKWPSASTIGDILKRRGLSAPRRRSRRSPPYLKPFRHCDGPNAVWSADFKGWFRTGDSSRCDPLTISDNYSRYLLRCQAVSCTDFAGVKPIFEATFRECGLPYAIRTDNGPPFATTTVGGLSHLSIWWLKLGIMPERIESGKPAQNGRHERMHRTLKAETAKPPQRTLLRQQQAFDHFRKEYNYQRPHQALQQQTPASHYQSSDRRYPLRLPQITYPDSYATRKVHPQGDIVWKEHQIYLSVTLAGEYVGFEQADENRWQIYFGPIPLAILNTQNFRLIHHKRTRKQK